MRKLNLINSSTLFYSTLLVIPFITLLVYFIGLVDHRSLYQNALTTTTILFFIFFCFILWGLYKGWKLKDTLGDFRKHFGLLKKPENAKVNTKGAEDIPDIDFIEAPEGCAIAIILWIGVGIFGSLFFWFIGAFFWGLILIFAGLLYWIFFRAFRMIFKNSSKCKGNIFLSIQLAILYSVLYSAWIYGIIFIGHYLQA